MRTTLILASCILCFASAAFQPFLRHERAVATIASDEDVGEALLLSKLQHDAHMSRSLGPAPIPPSCLRAH